MNMTYVRTGATVVISALAGVQTVYPQYPWLAVIIAAAATLGIHAIPAVSQVAAQVAPALITEVEHMADNDHAADNPVGAKGNVLMGVAAPTAQKTEVTAVPEPVAEPVETDPVEVVPDTPETAQKSAQPVAESVPAPGVADLLRVAIDALTAAASRLE